MSATKAKSAADYASCVNPSAPIQDELSKPIPLSPRNAVTATIPSKSNSIAESGETYLEAILLIKERTQSGLVRAVDIANELGYSKPSVSRALVQLKDKELINIEPSGAIVLTKEGMAYAQKVFLRHRVLTYFLRYVLTVPAQQAEEDACRMEHVISDTTLEHMIAFLKERDLMPESAVEAEYY